MDLISPAAQCLKQFVRWYAGRTLVPWAGTVLLLGYPVLTLGYVATAIAQMNSPQATLTEQARQSLFQERNQLWQAAQAAKGRGNLDEAIATAEKLLVIDRQLFGDHHTEVAYRLGWIAGCLERKPDFAAAEARLAEALTMQTKLHGAEHWQTVDARLAIANLALRRKLSPDEVRALDEADQRTDQALARRREGNNTAALKFAVEAHDLRLPILGVDHPVHATSLYNVGFMHYYCKELDAAEKYYRQALEVRERLLGKQHPLYAACLDSLGRVHEARGELLRSMELFHEATSIKRQAWGDQHPEYAMSLSVLAGAHRRMGDLAQAKSLYIQAFSIYPQPYANIASIAYGLAQVLTDLREFAAAESALQAALEIAKIVYGDRHPHYLACLDGLGNLYTTMGDYAKAETHIRQALTVCRQTRGEKHRECSEYLNSLGVLYSTMGEFGQSEAAYSEALMIMGQAVGEAGPDYALSLNNLGSLYNSMGKFDKAVPLFEQALAIYARIPAAHKAQGAVTQGNLAYARLMLGEHDVAKRLCEQAMESARTAFGEEHPVYALRLHNLSAILANADDLTQAEQLSRRALDIIRKHLEANAAGFSERQQLAMTAAAESIFNGYLSLALSPQSNLAEPELYRHVLARKGAVFVQQARLRGLRADPALKDSFAKYRATCTLLASRSLSPPAPDQQAAWLKEIGELTTEKEKLEARFSRESAAFQQSVAGLSAHELQALLPPEVVLIDFLEYMQIGRKGALNERRLAAFVVRNSGEIRVVQLGPAATIDRLIETWRGAMQAKRFVDRATAVALREHLWNPLEPYLGDAQTILISPDGALSRFTWAALPGKEPAHYLIEDYALAVIPTPQFLLRSAAKGERANPSLLLVGDISYGAAAGVAGDAEESHAVYRGGGEREKFVQLAQTGAEMKAIATSFEGAFASQLVTELRAERATESAFREVAPQHRWVHIATHGFFAPDAMKSSLAPVGNRASSFVGLAAAGEEGLFARQGVGGFHPGLLSGLALAGANLTAEQGQDDGILSALEVAALDLSQNELVVLSACETGLGKSAAGESLLGLQRAFQVSGARSTVATLWSIDDRASKELMVRFYENLWSKKMSKAEALRQAQLWMLRQGAQAGGPVRGFTRIKNEQPSTDRTPPFYWAAFVLSGDWR